MRLDYLNKEIAYVNTTLWEFHLNKLPNFPVPSRTGYQNNIFIMYFVSSAFLIYF